MTAPLTDKIAQLEYVIREQMAEIDQLRAEVAALVDWIAGETDRTAWLRMANDWARLAQVAVLANRRRIGARPNPA